MLFNSELFFFKECHFKRVRRGVLGHLVDLGIKTRVTCVELTDAGFDRHGVVSFTAVDKVIEARLRPMSSHETFRG